MDTPVADETVAKARYLIDLAYEIHPDLKIGLTALELAGLDGVFNERYRVNNRPATDQPDGWCVWCTTTMAVRWFEIRGNPTGVCDACYSVLNRGR